MNPFHPFKHTVECSEIKPPCILEWEVSGDDMLLRPLQSPPEIVWSYLGQGKLRERLTKPSRQQTAARKVGKALVAKKFWRFWPSLVAGGELFLRREFGLIRISNKPFLARFNFSGYFKSGDDVLLCDGQRLARVVNELEALEEFHAALNWLRTYEDDWSNVWFEKGTRRQLEELLRGFWALFQPNDIRFEEWTFTAQIKRGDTLDWHWPHLGFARDENEQVVTRRLLELMHEGIVGKRNGERHYTLAGDPEYVNPLQIRASLPTMHERMEALLVWREFLSDKVSSQEVEELLPKS